MDRPDKPRIVQVCAYCEAEARELYHLPPVRPMGEQVGMMVCRFCYIRLAGVKPHRRAAIGPGDSVPAR